MPDVSSANKSYIIQSTGDNDGTWGVKTNTNLSTIDLNFGGRLDINAAGNTDITVSVDEAENVYHEITGVLTGNINYILPDKGSFYFINNLTTGAFTITVKPDGGTGVVITQSAISQIFVNPDSSLAWSLIPPPPATPSEDANTVYAGPSSGSPATPTFRALVTEDVPTTFQANTFTGGQATNSSALTSSSNSTAIDLSLNNDFTTSLTENTTLANPSNITAGQKGSIMITQNASAAKTVAYGSYYKFSNGITPSVSTTLSAVDILYYDVKTTTFIACNLVKGFA